MDEYFVAITVEAHPSTGLTKQVTYSGTCSIENPQDRYIAVYRRVCEMNGLPQNATAVMMYHEAKMPR